MSLINYDYQAFSLTERIWLYLGQKIGSIYRRDRMNHKYLLFMDGIRSSNLSEFIVDFRTKRYEAFRITEVLRNVIPEEGDLDWLRQFYASIIKPEYKVVFALQDITEQKCREEWMQYKIEHDELTGTLNRAAFSRVIKLLSDSDLPLAFVLMDIDKFKVINDTYGDDVGDKVLSRLVVVLNEKIRTVDKIFRIDGDEFAIIMTRIVEEQADYVRQVVDSINKTIMEGYEDIPVFSVSAGVSFSEAGYSDSLYLNADKALYQTKESSRMGCTIYGEN